MKYAQPALATSRVSSKAIRMRSGWLRGSIYWVLLVLGSALLFQNHYPRFTGAPSCHFRTPLHALLRWIGARFLVSIG